MLNVSTEFKNALYEGNRNFNKYATITLSDGTVLELDSTHIWTDGFSFSNGSTEQGKFTIGTVIIGSFTLLINNINGEFSDYNFADAIVEPYLGLQLSEVEERIKKGVYIVDLPTDNTSIIKLECLDYMSKFNKPFDNTGWFYPITMQQAMVKLCANSGVTLLNSNFDGSDLQIIDPLSVENRTNRQVLAFIMQATCNFAYLDNFGRIGVKFYNRELFEKKDYDGGHFDENTPYSSGDDLDGGLLMPHTLGDIVDEGFFEEQDDYHHFYSLKNLNRTTEDINITGVQVTEFFEETEIDKIQTYLYGEQGYVVSITNNPLISKNRGELFAIFIGTKLNGMKFRPMNFSTLGDPTVEEGDNMIVTDRKGQQYKSYVTNYVYTVGQLQQISCDAETKLSNNSTGVDVITKIIQQTANETQKKISEYDKAVQQLTELITKSFGSFKTEETLEDGSKVFYMHDKPLLEDSATIWKQTADAFAVSTDGGQTWNAGIDSSGHAVVNVLSAVGINADWINAGIITDITSTSYWDLEQGFIAFNDYTEEHPLKMKFNNQGIGYHRNGKEIAGISMFNEPDVEEQTAFGPILYRDGTELGLYAQNSNGGIEALILYRQPGAPAGSGWTRGSININKPVNMHGKEMSNVVIKDSTVQLDSLPGITATYSAPGVTMQFQNGILVYGSW